MNVVAYELYPDKKIVQPRLFGQSTSVAESDSIRDTSLGMYLISSLMNAALSWAFASGYNPMASLLDHPSDSHQPIFYVMIPEQGSYQFGFSMRF